MPSLMRKLRNFHGSARNLLTHCCNLLQARLVHLDQELQERSQRELDSDQSHVPPASWLSEVQSLGTVAGWCLFGTMNLPVVTLVLLRVIGIVP